jgi:glucose/mannose-6-phosphate isomerase
MNKLDSAVTLEGLDPSGMQRIVFNMPEQLREAVWMQKERSRLGVAALPPPCRGPVIVAGMGGSAIGGDLVAALAADQLNQPMVVWRDYGLPKWADKDCFLILSSYSGNTAETLSAFDEGRKRGCHMAAVTSGGEVEAIATSKGIPVFRLPGGYPPRGALAFSTVALWTALSEMGLLPVPYDEFLRTAELLEQLRSAYLPDCPAERNHAKRVAEQLHAGMPIIYGSHSVTAVAALRWRGQLAENSKMLASHHLVPEMNHNEIVGYQLPLDLLKSCIVIFLRDAGEDPRVARRIEATSKLLHGRTKGLIHLHSSGNSLMARIFSLIYLGDCVSYYAAMLNEVDPYPVEMIDALKYSLES